ncbi:thioesterase [Rathayibacter rathayi]|uniref:Thioesterase n=1 Tax=Rathayibacter rathayi TaxID=33887 RepID=A0ABX5ABB2_RATRA|nr:thioesterase domain-containing protein [Rathayibacter rathayi]MWV75831.1 hypothetical protein [Rathayibacter rathayi NCPPB 2980 = VKM Ac-1601]PPF21412.1 thioesterase [Rathayibacter rathayi]PPF45740.1 thioesterase [Rathayibacter rathayi]PPF78277.1 thioesterase [Rathayibacter rathayi]PPG11701.1 thioesterase [Rathayibacter rathayi]
MPFSHAQEAPTSTTESGTPRVVLVPPAGGSALLRRLWSDALVGRAQVTMPRTPKSAGGTLFDVARALADRTPREGRWILTGHSLGGLIAFETVRALEATRAPLPERLIVMGSQPPTARSGRMFASVVDLDDDRLIDALVGMGAVDAALRQHPMRKLFTPGIRADLRLLVSYTATDEPVGVDLHTWHGTEDLLAPPSLAVGWEAFTAGRFLARSFEGGHFFPTERVDEATEALDLAPTATIGPLPEPVA